MQKKAINIVWLKRDLRLYDHEPLQKAIEEGLPILLCFFFEPSLMECPQSDMRHWRFCYESLLDMQNQLKDKNLFIFHDEVTTIFNQLQTHYSIQHIFSHQETGILHTFKRDKVVKKWCLQEGISWKEYGQDGVIRGRKHRFGWEEFVNQHLSSPICNPDLNQLKAIELPSILSHLLEIQLPPTITISHENFQKGGETLAWRYLRSFKDGRAKNYLQRISKPSLSRTSCSRLSPYIAWGNLSIRQINQFLDPKKQPKKLADDLQHCLERLFWRSHYLQKLETEYQLEFEPTNRALTILNRTHNPHIFQAWVEGRTGFPMIDASMRSLQATGWLNFRMRAMLVTFITFTLWQDWKEAANVLARLFLDFEPGIHYGQFQMQAGLTGYHTLRIYNPIVQAKENDMEGIFVHKWIPELKEVPVPLLYEPWKMTLMEQQFYNCEIGTDYPFPIVNFETATKEHRDHYWQHRQAPATKQHLPNIWAKHCLPTNILQYRAQEEAD